MTTFVKIIVGLAVLVHVIFAVQSRKELNKTVAICTESLIVSNNTLDNAIDSLEFCAIAIPMYQEALQECIDEAQPKEANNG